MNHYFDISLDLTFCPIAVKTVVIVIMVKVMCELVMNGQAVVMIHSKAPIQHLFGILQ
jgi:hypothetical protein